MPSPFDSLFAPDALVGTGGPTGPTAPTTAAPPSPSPSLSRSPFDVPAVATPPFVSPTPAPTIPSFGRPPMAPTEKTPNFLSMALPIIASTLIGRKDPRAIAEGLAGFMQGRELKRKERESAQQTAERKQAEQADFYSRALTQAQTIDDPVAFEQWKHAIAPVAQLHGVDPNVFTFNDSKRLAREKKEAGDLLATLDKQHPDGNYTAQWKGRHVTRAELAAFAGEAAYDDKGAPLAPGSTTNAQRFVASVRNADGTTSKVYAFEDPKTRKVTDATGKDITASILPPETNTPNAGSFEDYVSRYAKARNKTAESLTDREIEDARKRYNQADDVTGADAAPILSAAGLDAAARNYAQTGQLPAMGMGKSSAGVRAAIINRAAALYPDLDIAGNRQDYGANTDSLKALQKQRDAIGAFENTAQKNIDIFLETAGKIVDTGSPLANKVARTLAGNVLGSPNQAAYDAARQVAINEIAKITSNPTLAGTLSDSARHEVEAFNPQSATLKQTVAVMRLLKRDMQNRTQSLDEQLAAVRGRRGAGTTSAAPKVIRYDMNGKPIS